MFMRSHLIHLCLNKMWVNQNNSLNIHVAELIAEVDTGKGNRIITCHADSDKT
jgi:hypothetical protein